MSYYIYKCKHKRFGGDDGYPDIICKSLCFDCREKLIGTRQSIVRYGNIPECGLSTNFAENKSEVGVSCYYPYMTHRSEFVNRKKITGTAVIVGYGSDDEPLFDASTFKKT